MKIIDWFKKRWTERRVIFGYYLWVGIPLIYAFFNFLGYDYNLFVMIPSHIFGLYLIAKYHWFVNRDNGE